MGLLRRHNTGYQAKGLGEVEGVGWGVGVVFV